MLARRSIKSDTVPRPDRQKKPDLNTGKRAAQNKSSVANHQFSDIAIFNPAPLSVQPKLEINSVGDKYEKEADSVAAQVMAGKTAVKNKPGNLQPHSLTTNVGSNIQAKADTVGNSFNPIPDNKITPLLGGGNSMDHNTQSFMAERFGSDFSKVKIHTDDKAIAMNNRLGAKAFTVGSNIFFNENQYKPASTEGGHLLAHELTHTLQQNNGSSIMCKSLGDLPEATRKMLKVSRLAPHQADVDKWIGEYFDPTSRTEMSASDTVTEFGTSITDANLQKGLRNMALNLKMKSEVQVSPATDDAPEERTNTDPTKWPLPTNSILDLALDLSPFGGENAIFRFTSYIEAKKEKILVEKIQVIAAAVADTTATAATSFTGTVTVGNVKVDIDTGFGDDKGKIIADAVKVIPEPIRINIDGVRVTSMGSGTGPGGRAGDYKSEEDRVRLWGDAFDDSPRRIGIQKNAVYSVVHELMHVIDLRPLFKAQIAQKKVSDKKTALEAELTKVGGGDRDPLGEPTEEWKAKQATIKAEIEKLKTHMADLDKGSASAKSIAGFELGKNTESMKTAFGKALKADGVKPVTDAKKRNAALPKDAAEENTLNTGIADYASGNLMEAFAENFSIYILDDELLKNIRPKTYAFFVKAYPKIAAAKP